MKHLAREVLARAVERRADKAFGFGRVAVRLAGFRIANREVGLWQALPVKPVPLPPGEPPPGPLLPSGEHAYMVGWSAIAETDVLR